MNVWDKQSIALVISNSLIEIIEQNTPYQWMKTVEYFPHPYKLDRISYDYSGEVKQMTKEEFQDIIANLGKEQWYSSKLEQLLESIYVNQWIATYTSNHGKHWISYMNLLQDKFDEWKYENFDLYDEDGNELDEDLENELNQALQDFIENTSHEMYCKKISKKWG